MKNFFLGAFAVVAFFLSMNSVFAAANNAISDTEINRAFQSRTQMPLFKTQDSAVQPRACVELPGGKVCAECNKHVCGVSVVTSKVTIGCEIINGHLHCKKQNNN